MRLHRVRGLPWVYYDGGRAASGIPRQPPGDCVVRAIATATHMSYSDVAAIVDAFAARERFRDGRRSSARTGVFKPTERRILASLGWTRVPTMAIGSGTTVHLRPGELPGGRLIVQVSRHLVAVIDGTVYDLSDPCRDGTRCVYGYWTPPEGTL